MEIQEIKSLVNKALDKLLGNDKYLLNGNVNEMSISHKLATYLSELFPDYHVDCEYNKNIQSQTGNKTIHILRDEAMKFDLLKNDIPNTEFIEKFVKPDIIIHKRGSNENNLLVIEMKKNTSNDRSKEYDRLKLRSFISNDNGNELHFSYGLFIIFSVGNAVEKITTEWFINNS